MLTGDWQLLADIMFADLLLAVTTDEGLMIAAQVRPATASTLFEGDVVGEEVDRDYWQSVDDALASGEVFIWGDDEVEYNFVPVTFQGRRIAAVIGVGALIPDRVVSQAQQNYEAMSRQILNMIATGEFPFEETPTGYRHGTPRATDGIVHLDAEGVVLYASPNAVSHFRRLGVDEGLTGGVLVELVTERMDNYSNVDESLPVVLMGRAAWMAEVESRSAILSLRAVPLRRNGERLGSMLLCRDISELRRQERELLTKDATIREIHHRVKNNLQTVSALLRLQSRRAIHDETRQALDTAERRVATIALVHDQLSQTINEIVDFDELFIPVLKMVVDIAVSRAPVSSQFNGSFGQIRADQAAALSVVLNEIVSNAVEHGLPEGGTVEVTAERDGSDLRITVADDGVGIGDKGPGSGLGTRIVTTMVTTELHGRIEWLARDGGGTAVELNLRID